MGDNCSKEGRVGRNPIETPAFVDERKNPSIVGSFYPRCLTAVQYGQLKRGTNTDHTSSGRGDKPQTLMMFVTRLYKSKLRCSHSNRASCRNNTRKCCIFFAS